MNIDKLLQSYYDVSYRTEILQGDCGGDEGLARILWCNRLVEAIEADFPQVCAQIPSLTKRSVTSIHEYFAFSAIENCHLANKYIKNAYMWAMGYDATS